MSNTSNDLISGTIAGVISTTTGHPFDQLKIQLQTMQAKNLWEAMSRPYQTCGLIGYFRGLSAPIAFQGPIVGF